MFIHLAHFLFRYHIGTKDAELSAFFEVNALSGIFRDIAGFGGISLIDSVLTALTAKSIYMRVQLCLGL